MSSIAARSRPNAQLCQCSGNECSLSELKASWRQNLLATFPTAQPRTNNGRCEERSFASGNAPCPTRFSWSSLIQISTQIIDQNYDATLIDVHVFFIRNRLRLSRRNCSNAQCETMLDFLGDNIWSFCYNSYHQCINSMWNTWLKNTGRWHYLCHVN